MVAIIMDRADLVVASQVWGPLILEPVLLHRARGHLALGVVRKRLVGLVPPEMALLALAETVVSVIVTVTVLLVGAVDGTVVQVVFQPVPLWLAAVALAML
jgi:hypothetical protein